MSRERRVIGRNGLVKRKEVERGNTGEDKERVIEFVTYLPWTMLCSPTSLLYIGQLFVFVQLKVQGYTKHQKN